MAAESRAEQGRTSSRQSERHQQLQQALQEELKQRIDTTKQRQGTGRRLALTNYDGGFAANTDPHIPNNNHSSQSAGERSDHLRSMWGATPKRKAPPPPLPTSTRRRQSHDLCQHGSEDQQVTISHHLHLHQKQRRNSVRYNSMMGAGQTGGTMEGEGSHGRRETDQQTALYKEFPTVGTSQNHTHK